MKINNEYRIDAVDTYMEESFYKTEEGFLKGRAIVTNIGIFSYLLSNGTVQRELRLPEEVNKEDSLNTLKMKPFTNEHPPEFINNENISKYRKGSVGDSVNVDGLHVSVPIMITDMDTVQDAENGKRGISCGYTADIEYNAGVWLGQPYDAIQRNIKYNHVALVQKGRAGDAAVIKMDSADGTALAIGIQQKIDSNIDINDNKKQEDQKMSTLKKFKIDNVEYEAEADVIRHVDKQTKTISELTSKLDECETKYKNDKSILEAELDQLKEDKADLQKKLDEAGKSNPELIKKAVDARMVLLGAASVASVKISDSMNDISIKKAIIEKISPSAKEKLDSADEAYINARFDVALERLEEIKKEATDVADDLAEDVHTDKNDKKQNADSAREMMIDEAKNFWKKNLKEVE